MRTGPGDENWVERNAGRRRRGDAGVGQRGRYRNRTADPGTGRGTTQRLDAAMDQAMTAPVPGVIVGIWGPQGRYIRAMGVADKPPGAPMQTDFYSRIGSMTKTFTVTGIRQLADQRKVGLDDPIAKYIDGVPQGDQIRLRDWPECGAGCSTTPRQAHSSKHSPPTHAATSHHKN